MVINVLEYLERSAEKYPEKIAFADENRAFTYREVRELAQRIGSFIGNRCKGRKQPVAVLIDRNIESLVLFLGVVYSGNFYVPVDYTMPKQRMELIFNALNPAMIVSSRSGELADVQEVVSWEEAIGKEIDSLLLEDVRKRALDIDPLYAIFTSGSTGIPKGVLISHRSVIDFVEQFVNTFPFSKNPVFGNQAPFDFDVSVKDIYNSLCLGGRVEVVPKQFFSFPGKLISYLNDRKVNVIIWAVSALRIVANFKTFSKCAPEFLEMVMFSGEVMPVKVLNYWKAVLPDAVFVNLYGPTEVTCNCTYYIVDREFSNEENLPVGIAFRNEEVFLLEQATNRLISCEEAGVVGEICVKGTCLGLGYYNNPEKTAEVFVQNPLNPYFPEKIYRTGDLGQYDKNGELYFSARKDFQIKHMGHRIELGEIETAVNALDFVDTACCVYDAGCEKIILCYQAEKECEREIIAELSRVLPKYMWPNRYEFYEQIPMNKNGKMDRVFLKEKHCRK